VIENAKFEMPNLPKGAFDKITKLEMRLYNFGKDQRRTGRTSQDDFSDCLKRFAANKKIIEE
jgi:hypothetical protein